MTATFDHDSKEMHLSKAELLLKPT